MKILFKLNQYNQQRQYEKKRWIYPIYLAMYATTLKNQGNQIVWDGIDDGSFDKIITSEEQIDIPFLQLSHTDRILTQALNKKWQDNGNFKYLPATYIASANSCWYNKCTFCRWATKYPKYEVRPVLDVCDEIEKCISMGFEEIFDDSGSFPTGQWLEEFCKYWEWNQEEIKFGCNMRFGSDVSYKLMKDAGFRMILYGLESANQETLDKIHKGIDVKYAVEELKEASKYRLEPHIAVMFGYPWESDEDAIRTLKLVWYLLKHGYAKTAQASLYDPPDHARNEEHKKYLSCIYHVCRSPTFWLNKLRDIHNINDMKYLWRSIKVGVNALQKSSK